MAWGQSGLFAGLRSVTCGHPTQAKTALEWATRASFDAKGGASSAVQDLVLIVCLGVFWRWLHEPRQFGLGMRIHGRLHLTTPQLQFAIEDTLATRTLGYLLG